MDTVGCRIKEVRKSFKLTQAQFAQEIAISQTHVSKIEKDIEHPSPTLIRLISYRYNIDEVWLNTGIGGSIPAWNVRTSEGAISKYNLMRVQLEQKLKDSSGEDLRSMVESVSYLAALLTPRKLSSEDASNYLAAVCSVIDEFEKLTFMVSSDTVLPSKTDATGWVSFKNSCTEKIALIERHVKEATNLYLKNYGEEMLL